MEFSELCIGGGCRYVERLMDSLPFVKMSGAGNDFVVIDNRALNHTLTREQIAQLCDRHFGIGADGLLAVEPSDQAEADFRMRYYNADGGEAEMCGNGARCFARFVHPLRRANAERVHFLTPAGLITGEYVGDEVRINLTVYVPDAERAEVIAHGRAIRRSSIFPRGTNVNFVQVTDSAKLIVRTYERGVEDETLACGTGVVASALLTNLVHRFALPLCVKVRGGDVLTIDARSDGEAFRDVTLTGPATEVYSGEIRI